MSSVEEQPFELRLRVAFSREVIFVAPPVPNSPVHPSAPRVRVPLGSVVFYFDNWDIPGGNEEGAPTWGYDNILVHFVPETVPPAVSSLFSTVNHELVDALFWDPNHPSLAVFSHLVSIPLDETDLERARRLEDESARRDVESGLTRRCEEACDRLFAKPEIAEYFRDLSQSLEITTQRFLEVLRLRYQQVLIPDRPKLDWMNGHWILSEAVVPGFAANKPVPPSFTTIVSEGWTKHKQRLENGTKHKRAVAGHLGHGAGRVWAKCDRRSGRERWRQGQSQVIRGWVGGRGPRRNDRRAACGAAGAVSERQPCRSGSS